MRLEESLARDELDEDAADGPKIAVMPPCETCSWSSVSETRVQEISELTENDLWRSIMPSRDDCCVVVVVACCTTKVDEMDRRIPKDLTSFFALLRCERRQLSISTSAPRLLTLSMTMSDVVSPSKIFSGLRSV